MSAVDDYPFGSTITDSNERKVYVLGHELAHVEDADTPQGRVSIKHMEELWGLREAAGKGDEYWKGYNELLTMNNKRNENVADQRAKGIVESYRACTSKKGVCQ